MWLEFNLRLCQVLGCGSHDEDMRPVTSALYLYTIHRGHTFAEGGYLSYQTFVVPWSLVLCQSFTLFDFYGTLLPSVATAVLVKPDPVMSGWPG